MLKEIVTWMSLGKLHLGGTALGDSGVAVLVAALLAMPRVLPSTLVELDLDQASCGDDGLVALAAALPALTHLRRLDCSRNPATARGWVALVNVLPSLPALQKLSLEEAAGLWSKANRILRALARDDDDPQGALHVLVLNSSDDEYLSGPESELSFSSEEEDSADGEEDETSETEDEESGEEGAGWESY